MTDNHVMDWDNIRVLDQEAGADPDHPIGGTIFSSIGMYFGWTNEGAKRPRIEGEARTEGKARDIAEGGVGEGAR